MMYFTALGSLESSPATLLPLVLLLEPSLQRLEIFEQRAAVHLALAGHGFQRVRPWLAGAEREHLPQALTRLLAAVERALVQRALLPRGLAHRAVELELQDAGEEVARVRHVRRHMVLRAGIEVLLAAWNRRGDALIRRPQCPPRLVVIGGSRLAAEDVPAPLVDQLPER